ncbi:interferon-induced protein with tetratricopeptide repeats 1-like [Pempheris klunzingeri]|uniref:interferon-induced protein with tetratricopeptide repeats 1-like n=1 Tax=Pempheris klunzingeri TaxID=3127111 RepID=UPI003980EFF8
MSAAQSQTAPKSKLGALQCHFTWDLDSSRTRLLRLMDKLEDIGTEEGNSWLGHIYNLQGFIQYKLGCTEDAQSFFNKAAEAFSQTRGADEGPWLVVNYGNLAWLYHHLGEEAESQAYLSKVDALMSKHPPPSQDEIHPEVYAEKAWTLMKFSAEKKQLATDYFDRAIKMQPDMVQWRISQVIGLVHSYNESNAGLDDDILEKMRILKEEDPENLYLAAHYLEQRAKKENRIDEDEVRELARKVSRNPISSYSGMNAILWIYRKYISVDEAIDLAEEALRRHPDDRYLKRSVALCYKWKIIHVKDRRPNQSMIDRAIGLYKEVIALYPHSSILKKIELANIYAKSNHSQGEAEQIYQELLEQSDLETSDKQMLFNNYANYLNFNRHDRNKSIQYHKEAAKIPYQSFFRDSSIKILEQIKERSRIQYEEMEEFLKSLKEPQS